MTTFRARGSTHVAQVQSVFLGVAAAGTLPLSFTVKAGNCQVQVHACWSAWD